MKHLDKDIDWTIFEFLEGNLSEEEALYVTQQIASHDTWKAAHSRWKASYLESEHIPYPNIAELSQPKTRFKISRNIQWYAAAASVFIMSIWFFGRPADEFSREKLTLKTHTVLPDPEAPKSTTALYPPIEAATPSPQTPSATVRMGTPNPINPTLSKIRTLPIAGKHVFNPSPSVPSPDSFSKTIDVRPLPPKIKNPAIQNNAINEILASFFPGEIRADAGLTWVLIDSDSRTELLYPTTPQRISAATISIDTDYFQPAETPVPKWQQIWQRTKKGQLPAVQLAVETHPNSWIPSMNFNLRY